MPSASALPSANALPSASALARTWKCPSHTPSHACRLTRKSPREEVEEDSSPGRARRRKDSACALHKTAGIYGVPKHNLPKRRERDKRDEAREREGHDDELKDDAGGSASTATTLEKAKERSEQSVEEYEEALPVLLGNGQPSARSSAHNSDMEEMCAVRWQEPIAPPRDATPRKRRPPALKLEPPEWRTASASAAQDGLKVSSPRSGRDEVLGTPSSLPSLASHGSNQQDDAWSAFAATIRHGGHPFHRFRNPPRRDSQSTGDQSACDVAGTGIVPLKQRGRHPSATNSPETRTRIASTISLSPLGAVASSAASAGPSGSAPQLESLAHTRRIQSLPPRQQSYSPTRSNPVRLPELQCPWSQSEMPIRPFTPPVVPVGKLLRGLSGAGPAAGITGKADVPVCDGRDLTPAESNGDHQPLPDDSASVVEEMSSLNESGSRGSVLDALYDPLLGTDYDPATDLG